MALCSKCGQRAATVHLTVIVAGVATKSDFCMECSPVPIPPGEQGKPVHRELVKMVWTQKQPLEGLAPGQREALFFIQRCLAKLAAAAGARRHVTARDILTIAPDVAQESFGTDARSRLRAIGITSSAALGQIVFTLIEKRILSKTETDRIEDFAGPSALDAFLAKD